VLGAAPGRQEKVERRRPVVAVLDTGVGEHDWFPLAPETVVHRNQTVGGAVLGLGEPSSTEQTGVVDHPLEGVLDPYSGHGTFIAGLVHQQCPDADILSVRVMPSEGAVPEHALLDALHLLVCRQEAAQRDSAANDIVDVVSLSLGYYHEQVGDDALDPLLREPLEALGRCGVVVVVSAGNDSTIRPMYPAAFTPYPGGIVAAADPGCVPVVSVGAQNPDGSIALFSNAGPWVTCTQPGAALVSTFPKFDAAAQAAYAFSGAYGHRSTLDPDNFAAGFGVWSGTSFAAPVLAGKIAASLADGSCGSTDDVDRTTMLDRGWKVVVAHKLVTRP
jgi:subtilisin family serine protease